MRSKTIFYWKKSLKGTRFYFDIFFYFRFYSKSKNGPIIKQYLKIKISGRANMSTKMLQGINKTLLQHMLKKGPEKKMTSFT